MIKRVSYVVPCYNEEAVLQEFYRRIDAVASGLGDYTFEFVFINDGSTDRTAEILDGLAGEHRHVKVLHLAANRGHQAAITAGLDFASGDVVITIDADLQDPPELTGEILRRVEEGCDIVHMKRRRRSGESWFKLVTAKAFYLIMSRLTSSAIQRDTGDFRAISRRALLAVRSFREQHRFMRGIFSSLGFRQCVLEYDRDARYAGETKYPLMKMLRLAANALMSFSSAPIRFIASLSFFMWFVSIAYLVKSLVEHFYLKTTVPGWTSIIILMTFFTGIIIFCLGIVATYVGRIFEQGQGRPIYWLRDARNIDSEGLDSTLPEVRLSIDMLRKP